MKPRGPLARTSDLLVEEFGDELLIYDQRTDKAHSLASSAVAVWRACDGRTTVDQLGELLSLEPGTVARALEELEACELLDTGSGAGVTRREATTRLVKIGAAVAGAPLIYSIAAPAPALAASQAFCLQLGCPVPGGTQAARSAFCSSMGCLLCQGKSCEGGSTSGSVCVADCSTCVNVGGRLAIVNTACAKTNCVFDACPG